MNIAFLTTEYVTESDFDGGLANYLYRVAQEMSKRGHKVEIFTPSDRDETFKQDEMIVHLTKVQCRALDLLRYYMRGRLTVSLYNLSRSYCLRKRLLKRHKERPFDIIQAASCFACGLLLAFRSPAPLVTRVSSYEPLFRQAYRKKLTLDQKLCEWLELLALRYSKAVYAPSRFLAGVLSRQKGLKVDVLQPPFILEAEELDSGVYQQQLADKRYLLFFGTIGFLKGGVVLAKALPSVLTECPEMYFVFAGKDFPGPDGQSMLQYIMQQAGTCKKQIIYLGILRHSQLYPVIAHSRGVVLPSLMDNLPNTMLEAMALGRVVIGTRGMSFEELIEDKVSGILVAPNNPLELSRAMRHIWNMSDTEREKMGCIAKERIKLLSPERTCAKLEQYFKEVCLQNHRKRNKFL